MAGKLVFGLAVCVALVLSVQACEVANPADPVFSSTYALLRERILDFYFNYESDKKQKCDVLGFSHKIDDVYIIKGTEFKCKGEFPLAVCAGSCSNKHFSIHFLHPFNPALSLFRPPCCPGKEKQCCDVVDTKRVKGRVVCTSRERCLIFTLRYTMIGKCDCKVEP